MSQEWLSEHDGNLRSQRSLTLSKGEALLLCASLHSYLRKVEQNDAGAVEQLDSGDREQRSRRVIGQLIWRLEEAAAWPQPVGTHSADAVSPDR